MPRDAPFSCPDAGHHISPQRYLDQQERVAGARGKHQAHDSGVKWESVGVSASSITAGTWRPAPRRSAQHLTREE